MRVPRYFTLHGAWNAKWCWSLLFHPPATPQDLCHWPHWCRCSLAFYWKQRGVPLNRRNGRKSVAALTSPEGRARLPLVAPSHFGSRGQQNKRHREGKKCIIHLFFSFVDAKIILPTPSFSAVYQPSHDAAMILMHVWETTVRFFHLGSPEWFIRRQLLMGALDLIAARETSCCKFWKKQPWLPVV